MNACYRTFAFAIAAVTLASGSYAQNVDGVTSSVNDYVRKLKQIAPDVRLPTNINAGNFLGEVQRIAAASNARDLTALGVQAAKIGLQIEEIKINFLNSQMCMGTPAIPIPSQYSQHVAAGCQLLQAHHRLNQLQQKALGIIPQ